MTPLALSSFFSSLAFSRAKFYLYTPKESNKLVEGSLISSVLGPSLWVAELTTLDDEHWDFRDVQALIEEIERGSTPFLATPLPYKTPKRDFSGSIMGTATPRLTAVSSSDARQIAIEGLPANYVLSRGDFLSFTYQSNPVRYAMHRVSTSVNARANGTILLSDGLQVSPPIRPGHDAGPSTGPILKFVNPVFKAQIIPKSLKWGDMRTNISEGASFSVIQVLR